MLGSTAGIDALRDKPDISDETLQRLQTTETSRLDRWGLEQDALSRRRGRMPVIGCLTRPFSSPPGYLSTKNSARTGSTLAYSTCRRTR